MALKCIKYSITFFISFIILGKLYCQESEDIHLFNHSQQNSYFKTTSSLLPVSITVGAVLYLINPILILEDKKLYAGITKEISVGWGKFGEHRTAFEYSLIISGQVRHFIRFSYKYDFLLDNSIQPSHILQGTSVVSLGGGYFNDFSGGGFFPEITYGYSIRNDKFLIYPHVKLRHTFMFSKSKSDITDLSFGIIVGFANPFIDLNIKRKY